MSVVNYGVNVLICDCDGVLIDSEVVVVDVIVCEFDVCWLGVDVWLVVMLLFGLCIECVLVGVVDVVGCMLLVDDVDVICCVVEVVVVNVLMVDGIDVVLVVI